METRAHHVLIGTFAVLAFVLGLGFVLWLSKTGADSEFLYYDIVFGEAVTGLSKGGLVQYNGIQVGQVSQLKLDPRDPSKVIARVRIDGGTPIKTDTEAVLGLLGVTGTAFIQLSGGTPESPLLLPSEEEPIPAIVARQSALSKLLSSGDDIVTSVNQSLLRIGQLLSRENIDHVSATLDNIDKLAATVADQRGDLSTAMTQLAEASSELKSTLATLERLADTTQALLDEDGRRVMESTNRAIEAIERVADSTQRLLDENQAAISGFSEHGLRQVGPALSELRETLRSFRQLSDQLGSSNTLLLGRDQPREFQPR
jgi:phospholipid/cholesterol/gamma-HCH transport system substrate-binding protein